MSLSMSCARRPIHWKLPFFFFFKNRDGPCVRPTFRAEENGQRQPHNRIVQLFLSLSAYELISFVIIIICNEQSTYVDACILFFVLSPLCEQWTKKKKRLIVQWCCIDCMWKTQLFGVTSVERVIVAAACFVFKFLNPTNTSKGSMDVREFRVRATAAYRLKEETIGPHSLNNNYYYLLMN